jgi:K+-sensing histidine kinase KdpD
MSLNCSNLRKGETKMKPIETAYKPDDPRWEIERRNKIIANLLEVCKMTKDFLENPDLPPQVIEEMATELYKRLGQTISKAERREEG